MKKLILIIVLLFAFSSTTYANVICKESGKEIEPLKTTEGYLYVNDTIKADIANLKSHTVIVMLQKDGLAYRGAGIAIDKRHILTVNHGAATTPGSNNYYFAEENGKPYDAIVIKNDPTHDLALLEIDKNAPDLPDPMTFATNINTGDTVYTIGHPNEGNYSLTKGYIQKFDQLAYGVSDAVLLDIKIKEGNSGGFVINNQGELVGMIFSGSQVITRGYMIGKDNIQNLLK